MPVLVLLSLMVIGLATGATAQDFAAVANSPEELVQFVNTHSDFDWEPLWKTLNIPDDRIFLPHCEVDQPGFMNCSAKLIRVDSSQTIVLLEDMGIFSQVFLRYKKPVGERWTFSGAYAPNVKYFPPEHRLINFGPKPFLILTEQGISGSGVSSAIESWFDLTRVSFEPVLSFPSKGDYYAPVPGEIDPESTGVMVSFTTQPVESVTVKYKVDFRVDRGDQAIRLGSRIDKVTYARTASGSFEELKALSTVSQPDISAFYDVTETSFDAAGFLKFNYRQLAAIAARNPHNESALPARQWLIDFLQDDPGTPESRRLKTLLKGSRQRKP